MRERTIFALFLAVSATLAGAVVRAAEHEDVRPWILGGEPEPLEGAIVAERPSFSTSPDATPAGHVTVEAGVEYGRDDRGGSEIDRVTLPFALARLGLVRSLELRLGWSGYSEIRQAGRQRDSLADPSIGFKWQLNEGRAGVPRTGLVFDVGIPVGEGTGTDEVTLTTALAWSHGITDSIGLFGTSTIGTPQGVRGDAIESTHAAGVGLALGAGWGTFAEYFATVDDARRNTHTLDAGITFLVTNDLQLDGIVGVGLDDGAGDAFFGLGGAWRW
jgi:hypothetical protein